MKLRDIHTGDVLLVNIYNLSDAGYADVAEWISPDADENGDILVEVRGIDKQSEGCLDVFVYQLHSDGTIWLNGAGQPRPWWVCSKGMMRPDEVLGRKGTEELDALFENM